MAVYSRTIDYIRFDATTATLTINVNAYADGVFATSTGEVPCQLPVDAAGSVPSGQDLVDFVEAFAAGIVQPAVIDSAINLVNAGGSVSNAQDVFALTTETESGETPGLVGTGVPVVIFPDRTYTPSGNVFTRSVIAAVGANSAVPETGRFPSAYEQSVRLGNSILDNGNVFTDPWPHTTIDTTLNTIITGSPTNQFTVANPAGLVPGDYTFIPGVGNVAIDTIVGSTVYTSYSWTASPNAVHGLPLTFHRGTYAQLTDVFDDNYVYGVDSTQTVYVSAFGSGVLYPTGPIPGYIESQYPTVFGGSNSGLNYFYVEHNPITITSSTGYAWFKYS